MVRLRQERSAEDRSFNRGSEFRGPEGKPLDGGCGVDVFVDGSRSPLPVTSFRPGRHRQARQVQWEDGGREQ